MHGIVEKCWRGLDGGKDEQFKDGRPCPCKWLFLSITSGGWRKTEMPSTKSMECLKMPAIDSSTEWESVEVQQMQNTV